MAKKVKTNAMRQLDRANIDYELLTYDALDGQIDGKSVADKVGQPEEQVYKTLVTHEGSQHFVFVIPVTLELDMKKASKVAGVKKLEMLHVKDLLPTTGYIRGGCSPVGMKKQFPTFIHAAAEQLDQFCVSAGQIGAQIQLNPEDLQQLIQAEFQEVTK